LFVDDMSSVQLYDGAAEIYVPAGYINVSMIREVPDQQEVFCSLDTDQSLIVEILEREDSKADGFEALSWFAQDLAEANGAEGTIPFDPSAVRTYSVHPDMVGRVSYCGSLSFMQRISKFRESVANDVFVIVGLVRLPSVNTDITISLSTPIRIDANSSSAKSASHTSTVQEACDTMAKVLQSFVIRRWALFDA